MILYSPIISPRLRYVADFIGNTLTGAPFQLTDREPSPGSQPFINYSNARIPGELAWIKPTGLLFETGINKQETKCFSWNDCTVFFETEGDLPFDIFSACFYLISRYEEYLPNEKDIYGRFAYEESLAFREGFLDRPLINEWIVQWGRIVKQKNPSVSLNNASFSFLPTYDIDEAWSYLHKSLTRVVGASAKNLLARNWTTFRERQQVRSGKINDPFDSYEWMDALHKRYKLKPDYFFLVASKVGKYDRNILPTDTSLQKLIKSHAELYRVGVHPSWQTGDDTHLLKKEILTLEKITEKSISCSRQHFIRFNLPHTYRDLIRAGIREDYSMGYGSINGFRASVASPFYWYDLENNEQTELLIQPFCYMDANSFFEQMQDPGTALEEMRSYYKKIKAVNGKMITIWHNTFLGTARLFRGWREVYEKFVSEIA